MSETVTVVANGSSFSFEKDFKPGEVPTIGKFAQHVADRCAAGSTAIVYPSGKAFQVQLATGGSEHYQFTVRPS